MNVDAACREHTRHVGYYEDNVAGADALDWFRLRCPTRRNWREDRVSLSVQHLERRRAGPCDAKTGPQVVNRTGPAIFNDKVKKLVRRAPSSSRINGNRERRPRPTFPGHGDKRGTEHAEQEANEQFDGALRVWLT